MIFPPHKASLHLTHNQHKAYYETVEQHLEDLQIREDDWVSPAEKQRAYETQELWELQWYPETPVGCHIFYASSLEALMTYVNANFPQL